MRVGTILRRQTIILSLLTLIGCVTAAISPAGSAYLCQPTVEDEMGPLYRPHAAVRNAVGEGYLLMGTVRSAQDCKPLTKAKIEIWLAGPAGHYGDDWRATLFSAGNGSYYFRSHVPPHYGTGRPHIHLMVTAAGYETLVTQHYPLQNAGEAVFDLVLEPAR